MFTSLECNACADVVIFGESEPPFSRWPYLHVGFSWVWWFLVSVQFHIEEKFRRNNTQVREILMWTWYTLQFVCNRSLLTTQTTEIKRIVAEHRNPRLCFHNITAASEIYWPKMKLESHQNASFCFIYHGLLRMPLSKCLLIVKTPKNFSFLHIFWLF